MFPFPACYYYCVYTTECAHQLYYNLGTVLAICIIVLVILKIEWNRITDGWK